MVAVSSSAQASSRDSHHDSPPLPLSERQHRKSGRPRDPRAPASVIRTRVTWVCRPPATMCSGCAVATLGAHDLDHLLDRGRA